MLSYNDDATISFGGGTPYPVSRHHRRGGAVRIGVGSLAGAMRRASQPLRRSIIDAFTPLVAFTAASDHARIGAGGFDYETDGWGEEITLANVLTYRRGYYQDLEGQIDDATWGWGVGLPIGGLAGIRYDEAWWPQAKDSGLHHVYRREFTAWIDVLEMRRVLVRPN